MAIEFIDTDLEKVKLLVARYAKCRAAKIKPDAELFSKLKIKQAKAEKLMAAFEGTFGVDMQHYKHEEYFGKKTLPWEDAAIVIISMGSVILARHSLLFLLLPLVRQ